MPDDRVLLQLRYTDSEQRGIRNLIIKYPVKGTRRSHLAAMTERGCGGARFREYIDSKKRQCVVILNVPIQKLRFNDDSNTRTIRLQDTCLAEELRYILGLGRLSGRYIKDIPRKMKRDKWVTVCRVPMKQAGYSAVSGNRPSAALPSSHVPQMLTYYPVAPERKKRRKKKEESWLSRLFAAIW